jgi:hypothetical protein
MQDNIWSLPAGMNPTACLSECLKPGLQDLITENRILLDNTRLIPLSSSLAFETNFIHPARSNPEPSGPVFFNELKTQGG